MSGCHLRFLPYFRDFLDPQNSSWNHTWKHETLRSWRGMYPPLPTAAMNGRRPALLEYGQKEKICIGPIRHVFFSFSENWLKLWVFKGVFSRLVISSLKFDSSPWKVTEPQKERIVFQASFFQGRTVKLRGSIIKKAIRLHIRCQGMPTWATSYMRCMSRQDGRCQVLGAVPKLQQKQWFCKLFFVPRYGIHVIIGIYIYTWLYYVYK